VKYFGQPVCIRQKQYEAVRSFIMDKLSVETIANKFDYRVNAIYALVRDARSGRLSLFPEVKKGPKERRTPGTIKEKIVTFRKENLSSLDIHERLKEEGVKISSRTIERILQEEGFRKLIRRTNKELGRSKKNKLIPERSCHLDFNKLEPFNIECPVCGVFFFLPYILESGIIDIVKKCNLPKSSEIGSLQASLSMLILKLIGNKRLSHMDSYDREPGLGVFAGLNVLPKTTYMSTYSCRSSEEMLMNFQEEVIKNFLKVYPGFYRSQFINLDFHSIPHFGDESQMEKLWCGSRGKAIKAANTIFAQDNQSNTILYARSDILRREGSQEIKKFISYWKKIKGDVNETLVFDCNFTKYEILDELAGDDIKFITLRKRNRTLIKNTWAIPKDKWEKINIPIPKRKYRKVSVYENKEEKIKDCKNSFRQIIIKDHGREQPTYIITNNKDLSLETVLEVYAKRWRIENKLSELVSFFNLNALSSPIMIRIHFDVLWSLIASTLYYRFTQDLRRFEKSMAATVFKKFINMPGRIIYDKNKFVIKIRKRAHAPILKGVKKLTKPFTVPWLNNLPIEIDWSA
jgi:transposase